MRSAIIEAEFFPTDNVYTVGCSGNKDELNAITYMTPFIQEFFGAIFTLCIHVTILLWLRLLKRNFDGIFRLVVMFASCNVFGVFFPNTV